jgi:hypothetical protein
MILTGQHGLQVELHARLGRAPAEQPEGVARKLGLGDERGQAGQQQHGHGPGRKARQQESEADKGNAVLHQAEAAHDEGEWPARRLAPRAGQLVVELGVLEVAQVERERLREDHFVDALSQLRTQQRLASRQAALGSRKSRDEQALERDVTQHIVKIGDAAALMCIHGRNDGVHDQGAHPCDAGWQYAGEQRQRGKSNGELATGGPDQVECMPRIAEDLG